ncbi:MAG TPA: serine hydrolase domain-containing protein [Streptosporangiaceae bacterium]|jgi:CubicO group peptidase (beta-lactamase class C family)
MQLQELIAAHDVPGICVGTFAGGVERYEAVGVRSIEDPVPVSADTLFRVASITKTVTACTLMRLVADGRVDIDAYVRAYLPDFRVADAETSAGVTVRDLVTHRTGWEDAVLSALPMTEHDDGALARAIAAMAETKQIFPLGRYYSYSNAGFAVAGRIIEVVAGRPYEEAVRQYVTEPMGLRRTFFFTDEAITYPVALGHTGAPPQVVRPWWRNRARAPQGGLMSTARELISYSRSLLDGAVLTGDVVKEMWRPHAKAAVFADSVGVAWHVDDLPDGRTVVSHSGRTAGFGCRLAIVPERGEAYVVLLNSDSAPVLVHRIARELLGLPEPAEPEPIPAPDLTSYAGAYTNGDEEPHVGADGTLELPGEPAAPLRFSAPDEARAGEHLVRFLRADDGAIAWLRVDSRVFRRVR